MISLTLVNRVTDPTFADNNAWWLELHLSDGRVLISNSLVVQVSSFCCRALVTTTQEGRYCQQCYQKLPDYSSGLTAALWGPVNQMRQQAVDRMTPWFSKLGILEGRVAALNLIEFLEEFDLHNYRESLKEAYLANDDEQIAKLDKLLSDLGVIHLL